MHTLKPNKRYCSHYIDACKKFEELEGSERVVRFDSKVVGEGPFTPLICCGFSLNGCGIH